MGVRSSCEASARKRRVAASLARASSTAFSRASTIWSKAGGEAAELGVGAAGLEAELGVAVGDACGGLDDGGEGAQGGAGAVEDEEGGERERGGCDEELDEKQVGDGVVDARAAGGEDETCVRSGRTSSRMSSDPCVWIVELVLAGPVAGASLSAGS